MELSEVELFDISDKSKVVEVKDLSIVDVDFSNWSKTEGLSEDMIFSVNKKPTRSRAVEVDVTTTVNSQVDNLPVFDFGSETIVIPTLPIGDEELKEMINDFIATDVEDNDLTSGAIITSVSAKDIVAGTMYSVVYEVTDSHNNTVIVSRAMYVDDGTFVRVGNYLLKANDFVMKLSEYDLSDENVAKLSGLEIYDLSGKEVKLEDAVDLVIDTSLVEKKDGLYVVTFTSTAGPGSLDVNARVIGDLAKTGLNNYLLLLSLLILVLAIVVRKVYKIVK